VFGQHVHIGCASGDDAMYLLHALSRYIPHFIALSASSPFVQGHDSRLRFGAPEFRVRLPDERTRALHLGWDEFANVYFAKMERTGIIKSMKDFYWDLRPKPEYGTIELRVCDTPLTVERAAALAAYLQALCSHLLERAHWIPRAARRGRLPGLQLQPLPGLPLRPGRRDHASEDLRAAAAARGHPGDARTPCACARWSRMRTALGEPGGRRLVDAAPGERRI
jgi:gamma-glutamyl:cysteine ligase YbdK (ATP-grasp superfamily)